jgi:ABC-2 type transport system permease protein
MKKYWTLIKNTWNEALVYRLNFVLWRVRIVIRFLITYFLWSTILKDTNSIFGYSKEQMFTYIFLVYVVGNFVFATRTQDIGEEINNGKLTNYLLRPIGFFKSMAARDVSDKLLNFSFTVVEFVLFLVIFRPPFFIQTNPVILLLFT